MPKSASRKRRPVSGVIAINKPLGLSSASVVNRVRWNYAAEKAGHTGTLDPMASGVLPVCLGDATRFSSYLLNADKAYRARVRFGVCTATGDLEGEELSRHVVTTLDLEGFDQAMRQLSGRRMQTAPLYSALKYKGRPLYEWARKGIEVPLKEREIELYEMRRTSDPLSVVPDCLDVEIWVKCSKGTYIRRLAEELGESLGLPATLSMLERTDSAGLSLVESITLDSVIELSPRESSSDDVWSLDWLEMDRILLPVDHLLHEFKRLDLDESACTSIKQGKQIPCEQIDDFEQDLPIRVYQPSGGFLGLVKRNQYDRLQVIRLISL